MTKIVCFLLGIILVGLCSFHQYLFFLLPYLYYFFVIAGVFLIFYGILSKFIPLKYILICIILFESIFWGYLQLMTYKKKTSFYGRDYYWEFLVFRHRNYIQYNDKLGAYDSELFYTLKPNIKEEFNNFEFKTTMETCSLGVRDDENSTKSPQIITIGDSFTMGWGCQKEDIVANIIEKKTNQKVLNLGVCSYGTYRESQILKRANKDSLKLIILQYHETDIEENYKKLLGEQSGTTTKTNLGKKEYENETNSNRINSIYYPLKGLYSILSHGLNILKSQIPQKIINYPKINYDFRSGQDNFKFFDILAQRIQNEYKVPVLVYYIGFYQDIEDTFEKQYNGQNGIYFVPVNKKLVPKDFFVFDEHTNASGQSKTAQLVLEAIETNSLLK